MPTVTKSRIESIDVLRGLVMVIMALDHVRDFFHITAFTADPLDPVATTAGQYFTRWVTHLCAPVFIFLSGVSIYLQHQRKTNRELGVFLLKRGGWFILAEWTIVAFGWTFLPPFVLMPFMVIWAIGISMVLLGLMILADFSYKSILSIGFVVVLGHNLLNIPESAPGFSPGFLWDLLHTGVFKPYTLPWGSTILIAYPFLAWTGLMCLGYAFGIFYSGRFSVAKRQRILVSMGVGLILFFVLLRTWNWYGDPAHWAEQRNVFRSFLSFLNVTKYPPSLLYMSITMGLSLLLLAFMERFKNRFTGWMVVYGRTAFFYYLLHIYLIHILAAIYFFARGGEMSRALDSLPQLPFMFVIPGQGMSLEWVYVVWLFVVISLYPLCKWYDQYKSRHREKWWLQYI
ncbi:MAG: DUF1624 domain-containing protein [Saprospiraceae bacterium]|nr:DUF1624 domain-containing protein [Saprospiraceae bacterium]